MYKHLNLKLKSYNSKSPLPALLNQNFDQVQPDLKNFFKTFSDPHNWDLEGAKRFDVKTCPKKVKQRLLVMTSNWMSGRPRELSRIWGLKYDLGFSVFFFAKNHKIDTNIAFLTYFSYFPTNINQLILFMTAIFLRIISNKESLLTLRRSFYQPSDFHSNTEVVIKLLYAAVLVLFSWTHSYIVIPLMLPRTQKSGNICGT